MKLETLRKNNKKKILIGGLIGLSLVSAITLTTTRAKYKSTQTVKLATGKVNFKSPDLNVLAINISEDGTNYTNSETLPEGNYELNTEKSICKVNDVEDKTIPIEYKEGRVYIGVNQKNTKCYLYFDRKQGTTSKDTLEKLNITNYKTTAPTFTSIATTDEGIFETDDPMYATTGNPNPKTYYWRGAATTNHVIFANKCWRIVRINGDGTIRLIYDGATCHANGTTTSDSIAVSSQVYNSSYDNSSYVGWTYTKGSQRPSNTDSTNAGDSSEIKTATEAWFNNNSNFTAAQREQVAEGKFCNDRRTKDNATWVQKGNTTQYYAAQARLFSGAKTPTLDCHAGDIYILKAGAITADELQFAGASGGAVNKNHYLFNGQKYWTISPYSWDGSYNYPYVFYMHSSGYLTGDNVYNTNVGVRPVINLKADITISSGNGTFDAPYVIN